MDAKLKSITTWEAVCQAEGKDPNNLPDVSSFPEEDRDHTLADWMYKHVVTFFKQGRPTNLTDGSKRWSPWPDIIIDKDKPGGFGLSGAYFNYANSLSNVGSRLCSHECEEAEHIFTHFNDLYLKSQLK